MTVEDLVAFHKFSQLVQQELKQAQDKIDVAYKRIIELESKNEALEKEFGVTAEELGVE